METRYIPKHSSRQSKPASVTETFAGFRIEESTLSSAPHQADDVLYVMSTLNYNIHMNQRVPYRTAKYKYPVEVNLNHDTAL